MRAAGVWVRQCWNEPPLPHHFHFWLAVKTLPPSSFSPSPLPSSLCPSLFSPSSFHTRRGDAIIFKHAQHLCWLRGVWQVLCARGHPHFYPCHVCFLLKLWCRVGVHLLRKAVFKWSCHARLRKPAACLEGMICGRPDTSENTKTNT